MSWIAIKRVFRAGFIDFWRNGFVSFSSILMMVNTLFIVGIAMFTAVILQTTLTEFRDKADMNVYLTTDAGDNDIQALIDSLKALPQVASVTYQPHDEALAAFRERHKNDQTTLAALEELGFNPFGGVLNIKAKDISQYDAIGKFLQDRQQAGEASSIIGDINLFNDVNRNAITRLMQITDSSAVIGLFIIAVFIANTVATSFNTLRLVLYMSRDEIHVMRLVGAGQNYIRMPFVIEGIMYGLIAGVVTLLLMYPVALWLGNSTEQFFGNINIFKYYIAHFPLFFAVIMGSGITLGAVSSFLAVRRYLKI
jgi:cell division transport system permease protein